VSTHLQIIDRDIAEKHLLKHPFYLAWTRGELNREALTDYAKQYYHHVAAFPTYLSAVHSGCEEQATRRQLLDNLIDEEAGSPNHPQMWKQFVAGLGISEDEIENTMKEPETAKLIESFRRVCGNESTASGVAALYAYESQIPEICESKIEGLKKHYGFDNPTHYEYFTVHLEADREHSAAERGLLKKHVNDTNFGEVRQSANRVLDALWDMLSGVCRRHAIAC
jgi:pyrroloquinoline-quinone synthase